MLLHIISTVLLGPVLLLQGLHVRRVTERMPEPAGERCGEVGNGAPLRLLITGDSAAAGVGADHQADALLGNLLSQLQDHYKVEYQLLATSGHTTADCIASLQQIPERRFDVVLTSLGVNDVTSKSSSRGFAQRQRSLVKLLKNKFGAQQIILSGLPPMHAFPALPQPLRWYLGAKAKHLDHLVAQVATESSSDYLAFEFDGDTSIMARDRFHPGPQVYAEWAALAAQRIRVRW